MGSSPRSAQVDIPTSISHVNRLRSVTISAEPGDGKLVGDVQTAVEQAVQAGADAGRLRGRPTPARAATAATPSPTIFQALGVAMLLMYMLMMMLFGSLTLPLAVLMSLPLAVVGAFGAMALTHTPFTLFSLLGFAVLVGLVGKNAILLVDYTDILRARGYDRTAALLEAGPTRLRPIIMTTMSVMAALLPIASGLEEGSELLQVGGGRADRRPADLDAADAGVRAGDVHDLRRLRALGRQPLPPQPPCAPSPAAAGAPPGRHGSPAPIRRRGWRRGVATRRLGASRARYGVIPICGRP